MTLTLTATISLNLTGLTLLAPVKRPKKRSPMDPDIETDRYPTSGTELMTKAQRALQREGLYTNSNPIRIFGDILPNRYVIGYLPIGGVDIRH